MFSGCIIFGVFLLIFLLHEALQRYTAGKGGFQDHRCPVAHVTSLWKNKGVWKNLSSQGRKFLKKIICSRGKGCVSDAALVAMLFPWEKSPLTLGQWPRTGPAGGQRAQLPAPACSCLLALDPVLPLCRGHACLGDAAEPLCRAGQFPTPGPVGDSQDRET